MLSGLCTWYSLRCITHTAVSEFAFSFFVCRQKYRSQSWFCIICSWASSGSLMWADPHGLVCVYKFMSPWIQFYCASRGRWLLSVMSCSTLTIRPSDRNMFWNHQANSESCHETGSTYGVYIFPLLGLALSPATLYKTKCKATRVLGCFLLFNSTLLMSFCPTVQPRVLSLQWQDAQGRRRCALCCVVQPTARSAVCTGGMKPFLSAHFFEPRDLIMTIYCGYAWCHFQWVITHSNQNLFSPALLVEITCPLPAGYPHRHMQL